MGKAARWFRSLLGGGGRKDQERQAASPAPSPASAPADRKRWSFARSSRDSADASAAATEGSVRGGGGSGSGSAAIARAAEAAWLRSLYDDTGRRRQSKHAIAVAAATAAAADAAVAAAQAAVEVVRLTSQGPVFGGAGAVMDPRDRAGAAVKIQTAFRGFLAKKALRALKALVRLQALVRGYLVRRQAAVTLQSMQALLRAQATVRAARGCRALPSLQPRLHHPPARPRFSLQERHADDARSEHGVAACGRRLSTSVDSAPYDRSPKTVEMDTARPRSRASPSLRAEDEWYAQSASSSPLPPPCQHHHHHLSPRIEVPTSRHFPDYDYDWCTPEKPRPATAQCTPRCAPPTPAKSVCGGPAGYHGCLAASPSCPGYMSSTQSSEAKSSRSQSAPKQRPPEQQPARNRKRVPLSEVVLQHRASLGGAGVGTHKPCNARAQAQAQAPDAFDFRAAVVSRFEQRASSDAAAVAERDRDVFFLKRGW